MVENSSLTASVSLDTRVTSLPTGVILKLSDREYRCECGNIIDRDFQASINLKGYGERFAS